MSTTYNVQSGDTFDLIARKKYGDELKAEQIVRANPGILEPLTAGIVITIPDLIDSPQNLQQQTDSNNPDEVALLIDGARFRWWETMNITRSIDTMDTVNFTAPFESDEPEFRGVFKPVSYKSIVVTVGGSPLFTGKAVAVDPVLKSNKKTVSVDCYSSPGVMNDCNAPASAFPLEFDGLGLRDIAKTVAGMFGIGVSFPANQGAIFDPRVAMKAEQKVLSFLTGLASQRFLIMGSTPGGELLFPNVSGVGSPVATLVQGESPLVSVDPVFKPQEFYSHITGIEPASEGSDGSQYTVVNPHLRGVVRPYTFTAPDTIGADLKAAVNAKYGRMFGNAASFDIEVSTWRDESGVLWEPNTTLKLLAPGAMIYTSYEFLIRSVVFSRTESSKTATLNLVIPGSFGGVVPEIMPWDE